MGTESDRIANVTRVDTTAAQLLEGLDPDQRHAVTTGSRLVAVVAGAGSGKTRVLMGRIVHRVDLGDADPRHTLALTFTREAAGEIRRRLTRLGLREHIEAGTFHSVLLGLLRQHWADRGKPAPTVVSNRDRLLREALGAEGRSLHEEALAEIDWAAARGIRAEGYLAAARAAGRRTTESSARIVNALGSYETIKQRRGVIDLDDVLSIGLELFERDRAFAEVTHWRFRHILVDEAQDLNPLQHRLVDHLYRGSGDLFLVGDPAQAVYGFNGADPSLLEDVTERFSGVEVIRLRTNHRCTPQVVRAGVHVLITSGQSATAVESSRPDGPTVTVHQATDELVEAEQIVEFLRGCDPDLIRTGQVAVLARTHFQIGILRDHLQRAGIALMSRIDGPDSPYRPAIEAAGRLGSAARLRAWAHEVLDESRGQHPDRNAELEAATRMVAASVLDYLRDSPMGDGLGLRTWIVATDPVGHGRQQGVELLTFHASKGREWHTVAVTGVETGLVPHRSASTQAARAEEARLLYVALTRARDRLRISWAGRRGGYKRQISPLIAQLRTDSDVPAPPPPGLIEGLKASRGSTELRRSLDRDLNRRLLAWRAERARSANMLPEQWCSAATLSAICAQRPDSVKALAACTGVGELTAERWYRSLAGVLAAEDAPGHEDRSTGQSPASSTTTGA